MSAKRIEATWASLATIAVVLVLSSILGRPSESSAPVQGTAVSERSPGRLQLEPSPNGSEIRAVLRNVSSKPMPFRDVLTKHDQQLGYPRISVQFRDKARKPISFSDHYTHWSPYLVTTHRFRFLPVEITESLKPGQELEAKTSVRDLMRGLPDHIRNQAHEARVYFEVPLDEDFVTEVEGQSDWFRLPPDLRTADLLHGRNPLGVVYRN